MNKQINLFALTEFPLIKPGDNIPDLIIENARSHNLNLLDLDIVIITQKILSKSEGRYRNLQSIIPSHKAKRLARITEKKPQLIQLILDESQQILRVRKGLIIVRHRLGFVCANAGIDHSNTSPDDQNNSMVLLLPENPDKTANEIRDSIKKKTGKEVGVLIIDSHGRAWRNGTTGTTVGISGVPGIVDLRGKKDLFGYTLRATQVAAADELAAAASLLMGQADEGIPVVIARGFPYPLRESSLKELIRSQEYDLFK